MKMKLNSCSTSKVCRGFSGGHGLNRQGACGDRFRERVAFASARSQPVRRGPEELWLINRHFRDNLSCYENA